MTFILSGLFSGLAGVMLVTLGGNVNPQAHAYWTASAVPVVMTVIGGPLAFIGSTVGASPSSTSAGSSASSRC